MNAAARMTLLYRAQHLTWEASTGAARGQLLVPQSPVAFPFSHAVSLALGACPHMHLAAPARKRKRNCNASRLHATVVDLRCSRASRGSGARCSRQPALLSATTSSMPQTTCPTCRPLCSLRSALPVRRRCSMLGARLHPFSICSGSRSRFASLDPVRALATWFVESFAPRASRAASASPSRRQRNG